MSRHTQQVYVSSGDNTYTPLLSGSYQQVFLPPIHATASGTIGLTAGALQLAGFLGSNWTNATWNVYQGRQSALVGTYSRLLYSATNLDIHDTAVSIRCLAR